MRQVVRARSDRIHGGKRAMLNTVRDSVTNGVCVTSLTIHVLLRPYVGVLILLTFMVPCGQQGSRAMSVQEIRDHIAAARELIEAGGTSTSCRSSWPRMRC